MNAHKFVAEHGIDEAKRVLEGAPSEATHFEFIKTAFIKTAIYMQFCGGEWFWLNTNCNEWLLDYPNGITERQCLKELKQVVESLDTINQLCGLDSAKHTMVIAKEIGFTSDYEQIKQAIADHELVESYKQVKVEVSFGIALQNNQSVGAKCEVLDMVDVSPNCEVRNG